MLDDKEFSQAVSMAVEVLHTHHLPISNRSVSMLMRDVLKYFGVSRLRCIESGEEFDSLMYLIYRWNPSPEVLRRLKFQVIRGGNDHQWHKA